MRLELPLPSLCFAPVLFVLGSERLTWEVRCSRGRASVSSFIDNASHDPGQSGSQDMFPLLPQSISAASPTSLQPCAVAPSPFWMPAAPLACIVTCWILVVELSPPHQSVSSSRDAGKTSLFFHKHLQLSITSFLNPFGNLRAIAEIPFVTTKHNSLPWPRTPYSRMTTSPSSLPRKRARLRSNIPPWASKLSDRRRQSTFESPRHRELNHS